MSIARIYTSTICSGVATNYLDCWGGSAQRGLALSGSALLTSCGGRNMMSVSKNTDPKCQRDGLKTRAPAKKGQGKSQKLLLQVIL